MPPGPPLDAEERCRTAVARLPRPGATTRALGRSFARTRHALALAVIGSPALLLAGASFGALIALLGVMLVVVASACVPLARAAATCHRADRLYAEGRVEDAAARYDQVLRDGLVLPFGHAVAAVGLARCAIVAGHSGRAVVLLRALDASEAVPSEHADAVRSTTALALLALGRTAEARAVAASMATPMPGLTLLVEALGGPIEDAERAASAPLPPAAPGEDPAYHARRMRLGWLVRAYVAERVARAAPRDDERRAAEERRDAALAKAAPLAPWMHQHLHDAWPDFGAFARHVTAPAPAEIAADAAP